MERRNPRRHVCYAMRRRWLLPSGFGVEYSTFFDFLSNKFPTWGPQLLSVSHWDWLSLRWDCTIFAFLVLVKATHEIVTSLWGRNGFKRPVSLLIPFRMHTWVGTKRHMSRFLLPPVQIICILLQLAVVHKMRRESHYHYFPKLHSETS